MNQLILASTSIYRAQLIEKLGIPFKAIKPSFDEEAAKLEALQKRLKPVEVAETLSRGKTLSLSLSLNPQTALVGGDQLVHFEGEIIGKSKNFETAFAQLKKMRGKTHELITSVTLHSQTETRHVNHITVLKMKNLSDVEIENYLLRDQPYDCAGSYKIENLGITLFSDIQCSDFSAIQGIPLIWLSNQLKEMGYEFFKRANE